MPDDIRLEGYRECHICAVGEKMKARRCRHCTGRLNLRDLLLLQGEKRWRQRIAPVLSTIIPGLGHWFSGRCYIGACFFTLAPLGIGLVLVTYQKWNWGLTVLIISLLLVWYLAVLDSRRGSWSFQPPCQEACPAGISCSLYVHMAAKGMDLEALELVESVCPFPGTIGRVCHHPCEQVCNRGKDGDPVAICALKRFVDDHVDRPYDFYRRELDKGQRRMGKRIAVVGAGPSGLTAALYLRLFGFDVSLFEAEDFGGGSPAIYPPVFRLPAEVYRREVDRILNLDLDLRFGKRLGEDFSLREIEDEGFAAIYLAMGAMKTIKLPHTGGEQEGFLDGKEFLARVRSEGGMRLSGNVLIIGGGNVAIDVARSAIRSGTDSIRVVCPERRPESRARGFDYIRGEWREIKPVESTQYMPAFPWEIEEAVREGVEIVDGYAAQSFDIENGKLTAANCRRVERIEKDRHGRIVPVLRDGWLKKLEADWVLTAVGSSPDWSFLGGTPETVPVAKGIPLVRLETGAALTIPVVAGGDMASGPGTVIEAIAAGKEAALHLYRKLARNTPVSIRYKSRKILEPWANYPDSPYLRTRKREITLPEEERKVSFREVYGGYAVNVAREEAERCMRCDWPLIRESKARKFFRTRE